MTIVLIDVVDLGVEDFVPSKGYVRAHLLSPVLDDQIVTASRVQVGLDENGVAELEFDDSLVGLPFKFTLGGMPGLSSYTVSLPSGTVTMTELIEEHQIDPESLESVVYSGESIQDQLAELRQLVEAGGITDEQLGAVLEDYFVENPVNVSNTEWGDDPRPDTMFQNGLL